MVKVNHKCSQVQIKWIFVCLISKIKCPSTNRLLLVKIETKYKFKVKYNFNCQLQSSISIEMLTCIHTRYQSVLVMYSIKGSTKAIQGELTIVLEW